MVSTSFAREEVVQGLVRDASLAPSLHNAQPWRFLYSRGGDCITLRADPGRTVPQSDPELRSLHLGCGAALFNLRVAAQNAGFRPVVTLLPDPDDWQTLASVSLRETAQTLDGGLWRLYGAIAERRTGDFPFVERPIPVDLADLLIGEARAEGARMAFLSGWHLSLVLDVIEEAELDETGGGPDGGETDAARWARTGVQLSDAVPEETAAYERAAGGTTAAETAMDGASAHSGTHSNGAEADAHRRGHTDGAGTVDGSRRSNGGGGNGNGAPVRDFTRGRSQPAIGAATPDEGHLPHLGLLCTEHDHPVDWLIAGQAMERMVLTATREGLATSFASKALERPELRWLLRDPVWGAGPVQMVIRMGYGRLGPPTARRPVGEVLEVIP
ncbi:hypothetical protein K378_03742 [Streptomyces sp. Amel2xB2]|uniref:nitroreductase n=1 Tax=Streptomyces sp. Amel2xB2 TaxID=1305829 RepID=UPI000DBA8389|nr:nitroreductase [Streptomyces sp. Amel2xB2]RAJ62392.1 hypothetical protein K378_03742 [Streptomyces sp. Amel2xB2]